MLHVEEDGPIKVVYKYRNSVGHNIYKVLVFLRPREVNNKSLIRVLERIKDLSLVETLTSLTTKEAKLLVDHWGYQWHMYLFTHYHISKQVLVMNKESSVLEAATSLFGSEWIETLKIQKRSTQRYEDYVRAKIIQKLRARQTLQSGGDTYDDDVIFEEESFYDDDNEDDGQQDSDITEDVLDDTEIDLQQDAQEKDASSLDLSAAVVKAKPKTNPRLRVENDTRECDLGDSRWENIKYNQDKYSVCDKCYVTNTPLFWDDTILKVKSKICNVVKLPSRFSSNYLTPSRLHVWSEYFNPDGKIDKVTLGSNWIHRVNMIPIQTEPETNLNIYADLSNPEQSRLVQMFDKYGHRIQREDDENMILEDFTDFISNSEIYVVDIYNQLDIDSTTEHEFLKKPEALSNFVKSYVNIYFPSSARDFTDILDYLDTSNKSVAVETQRMTQMWLSLHEELEDEMSIVKLVEETEINSSIFNYVPYVTYAVQYAFIKTVDNTRLSLEHMFHEFQCDSHFPYIQLLTSHNDTQRKILKSKGGTSPDTIQNQVINVCNWLETSYAGLTAKVYFKESGRYLSVTLTENGRIQYKVNLSEQDVKTIDVLNECVDCVTTLIDKYNELTSGNLIVPEKSEYKLISINSVQKFSGQNNFTIAYDKLSQFASLVSPYVAIRKASPVSASFKYKRVSNYTSNVSIQSRILYYLQNYDINVKTLTDIVESEFKLTKVDAERYIEDVIASNPVIKKKAVLRPLSALVVSKHRGIVVDIQGTSDDTYRIKVTGAHNNHQMSNILQFVQRFITLYFETFVLKLPVRKSLYKEIGKIKTNVPIASREGPSVKRAARKHDADKILTSNNNSGDSVKYTRECQNSGNEVRRPIPILSLDELKKVGYKLNRSSGVYERIVKHPQTGEKVTLVAVKIKEDNKEVYYVCDPKVHKDRLFIGALSKSHVQLPCCFKKNQLQSTNKKIKRTFEELLKGIQENEDDDAELNQGDLFYVRRLTSKTHPERLHFLPPVLDKWLQKHTAEFRASKLDACPKGYLLVYGCDSSRGLLGVCEQLVKKSEKDYLRQLLKFIENMDESSFCFLEGGLIKSKYQKQSILAKSIKAGNESNTSFLFVELTMLAFNVNVLIIECQDDKDSYIRSPVYYNPTWDTFVIIIDASYSYHYVVETFISRDKQSVTMNTMFSPGHYLSNYVKEFVLSPNNMDENDVKPTCYGLDNLKGQVLDPMNHHTIYVVTKDDGHILPTLPSRCHPFLPVILLSDTSKHPVQHMLNEYKKWEWLFPKAIVVTRKKEAIALIVDVGKTLLSQEISIPVLEEEVELESNKVYGLPVETFDNNQNPHQDDDGQRNFHVNIEHIKDETYATLRVMLASQFRDNLTLRQDVIELIVGNKKKKDNELRVLKLLRRLLSPSVVRGSYTLDEWVGAHYQDIVNVTWDSDIRSKTPCSSKYGVGLLCGKTGIMTLPQEWYNEFFTKLTLQLCHMNIQGKELLLTDKYRVANIIEDRTIPRRSKPELSVSGPNPPIKVVLRLLFGDDVTYTIPNATINKDYQSQEVYHVEEEQLFYTIVLEQGNDVILRALVNGMYSLLYRQQFGLTPTILGPGNPLQKVLVSNVKGRIIQWLLRHVDSQLPTNCEVSFPLTRQTILNFTKNPKAADSWWIFTTWTFHRLFYDVPIVIFNVTDNKVLYHFSNGSILSPPKGKSDTKNLVNSVMIRVTQDKNGALGKVETLYLKE